MKQLIPQSVPIKFAFWHLVASVVLSVSIGQVIDLLWK